MNKRLVTKKEIMDILHVSITKLKEMEAKGILVGVQGYGKEKVYMKEDIDKLEDDLYQKIQATKDVLARV